MAGLTKEQRAERAAAKEAEAAEAAAKEAEVSPPPTASDEHLVTMTKDGEELDVHPSCVSAHMADGWKTKE